MTRSHVNRYRHSNSFSNMPLQSAGIEGRTVIWKGHPVTVRKVYMQGRQMFFVLNLPGGKVHTASADAVLAELDAWRKAQRAISENL